MGSVVSSIVKVAVVVLVLPQSSVAVKVTVAEPVAPQSSDKPAKLFDHVTSPQSSVALAPPLLANQVFKAVVFPDPSDSTVSSLACVSMVGSVESSTVMTWTCGVSFPQSSTAVYVRVMV